MSISLAKNSLIYLAGTVAARAGSILLLPIVTRALDPAEYGTLELLNRATEILLLCVFLNGTCLASLTLYSQARDEGRRHRVAATSLVFGALCIGAVGLFALTLAVPIGRVIGVNSPGLVRLAFSGALLEAFVIVALTLTQARVESFVYVLVMVAQMLVRLGLIALFVCVFHWGIKGVLTASLVSSGAFASALVIREVRRSGLRADGRILEEFFRFALPFLPGGFCGLLLGTGDQFFLVRSGGAWEVGLYALGYKLAMMIGPFTSDPLIKVWGVRMHHDAFEPDAPRRFGQVFSRFTILYLGVGLSLVLFSGEVLALLSSPRYTPAAAYVAPVALAYYFYLGADLMDAAFYVKRRTRRKLAVTLVSTGVILLLYLALIPRYHAQGAAYATLIGFLFRMALTCAVAQRIFPVRYEWRRVGAVLAAALVCWLASHLVEASPWAIPLKLSFLLGWAALLWTTGLVDADDKRLIARMVDRIGEVLGRKRAPVITATPE